MRKLYYNSIGRASINLFIEPLSRMSDESAFDDIAVIPHDGVGRVIVSDTDIVEYLPEEQTTCNYPTRMQLCVRAISTLTGAETTLWCFGDAYRRIWPEGRAIPELGIRQLPWKSEDHHYVYYIFKIKAKDAENIKQAH